MTTVKYNELLALLESEAVNYTDTEFENEFGSIKNGIEDGSIEDVTSAPFDRFGYAIGKFEGAAETYIDELQELTGADVKNLPDYLDYVDYASDALINDTIATVGSKVYRVRY